MLHRLLSSKCITLVCSLCNVIVDSTGHFIFTCPPKLAAWQGVICESLWLTVDTQDISIAFSTLDFYLDNYCQNRATITNIVLITVLSLV